MGVFDFLKKKPAGPPLENQQALVQAMARISRDPSADAQAAFESAFFGAVLLLGVREVPSSIRGGSQVLEEDTNVAVLHSQKATGEEVLFAFTSPEEVRARKPDAGIIGLQPRQVLEMVVESYDLLAINPGGGVFEITRAQAEVLLRVK